MVPLSTTLALCIPLVSSLIVPFRASPHVFPRAGQLLACDGGADLNLLQTRLYDAVNSENYAAASAMRDRIAELTGTQGGDVDWNRLDLPEWLADWLSRMHFGMATRVQMQALRSLSERNGALWLHRDAVIVSPTGSGKTLAYLLPMLRRFSADLLQEDLTRYLTSSGLVDRTSKPEEVPRPVLMVVVPSRELGVQVSLLAYRLLGGSPSNPTLQPFAHASRYEPGNAANMFTYTGPRRVKVAGLWDEQVCPPTAGARQQPFLAPSKRTPSPCIDGSQSTSVCAYTRRAASARLPPVCFPARPRLVRVCTRPPSKTCSRTRTCSSARPSSFPAQPFRESSGSTR